ncbi:RHS repeat-associated core domain-containing protein, partial [bacterium]|nr:RHS repeat-associated core domain-containing protein [bacterium]
TDAVVGDETIFYTYDAFGNRLSKTDSNGFVTYEYDANDRLLTEIAPGYTNTYTYDANGNTISKFDGTTVTDYFYDYENRLIGSQTGASEVTYAYDADGIRVGSNADGVVTNYLVDHNRDYAQVLEENDGIGSLVVSYVYGDDLISQQRGGLDSYYHYDGQMSTRQLTDAGEGVTDSYVYDAFGVLIEPLGDTVNHYRYTGEQYDANVGVYYLRARYYNQAFGRFTIRDPFEGIVYEPFSLHNYQYVYNNPVDNIDPSGLFSLSEQMTTVQIVTQLVKLNFINTLKVYAAASYIRLYDVAFSFRKMGMSLILVSIPEADFLAYECFQKAQSIIEFTLRAQSIGDRAISMIDDIMSAGDVFKDIAGAFTMNGLPIKRLRTREVSSIPTKAYEAVNLYRPIFQKVKGKWVSRTAVGTGYTGRIWIQHDITTFSVKVDELIGAIDNFRTAYGLIKKFKNPEYWAP